MGKCIQAHTNPTGTGCPGYINFTREDDGSVSVHLRGDPNTVTGVYVCGYAPRDKGHPGRCTPGDEHCNNYCNLAPLKGPMPKRPADCSHEIAGVTEKLTLSAADFATLVSGLSEPRAQ